MLKSKTQTTFGNTVTTHFHDSVYLSFSAVAKLKVLAICEYYCLNNEEYLSMVASNNIGEILHEM
jgi:hypothetical protein